jgi:hypothetical protein
MKIKVFIQMYSKHPEVPERLSQQEWLSWLEDSWLQDGSEDLWEDEDDNTGGIASIPRPRRPSPSPLTGSSPCQKIKTVSPGDFQPFFSRLTWVQSMKP